MNHIRNELTEVIALETMGLEATARAAVASLDLEPHNYEWLDATIKSPIIEQPQAPETSHYYNSLSSRVRIFGGKIVQGTSNSKHGLGDIQAIISEPAPQDTKHFSRRRELAAPFVTRVLTAENGILTVSTASRTPNVYDAPYITEGDARSPHYRQETAFDAAAGTVTVRSGRRTHDKNSQAIDNTVETDAFELGNDVLLPRLATVVRTIKAASAILLQTADRDQRINLRIVNDATPPRF